jgi:V8-like Glu-specific endopeptidase
MRTPQVGALMFFLATGSLWPADFLKIPKIPVAVAKVNGAPKPAKPIIQTAAGNYILGEKGIIKIEDKKKILTSTPGIPKTVDVVSTGPHKAEITDQQLPTVSQWETDLDTKLGPKQKLVARVSEAVKALDVESKPILHSGDLSNTEGVTKKYKMLREDILTNYAEVPKSEHLVRTVLARAYLTSQSGQKAWYGRDDNYRPEVYQTIYQKSKCCVGITLRNQMKPIGSGVLIGPDTVLTAKHVIQNGVDATDFDVLFNYEQIFKPENRTLTDEPTTSRRHIKSTYFLGKAPDKDSSPLDFVLLKIDAAQPDEKRPFVPISMDRVTPDTSIFLVGHPRRAQRLVHDNSWVKFPYEVSDPELQQLLVGVNAELAAAGSEDAAAEADRFMSFYKPTTGKSGKKAYHYVNQRGGKAMRYMGAECDTFHGDSGAPAMLRESGELIGILVAGEPDQEDMPNEGRVKSNPYVAGWLHHEKLLPITEVVDQLDNATKKRWRKECGVTISE